jgi:hypothetical protein
LLLNCIEPFVAAGDAILHDFYHRMRKIEEGVESFRTTRIVEWEGQMWVGFYKALRRQMPEATWKRVNNRDGGYWGCFWGWMPGHRPYFQLRERQAALCATAEGDNAAKRRLQQKWHHRALDIGREFNLPLKRPNRMRLGRDMTLAIVSGDYRQAHCGRID